MPIINYELNEELRSLCQDLCKDDDVFQRFDKIAFLSQDQPVSGSANYKWFSVRKCSAADTAIHSVEIIVTVYEDQWRELTEKQKMLLADLVMHSIKVSEKFGTLTKDNPDLVIHSVRVLREHEGVVLPGMENLVD